MRNLEKPQYNMTTPHPFRLILLFKEKFFRLRPIFINLVKVDPPLYEGWKVGGVFKL